MKKAESKLSQDKPIDVIHLLNEVKNLHGKIIAFEKASKQQLSAIDNNRINSAKNLLHYLAMRKQDLRKLQSQLASLGLSSLGRAEPNVLATVEAVKAALIALTKSSAPISDTFSTKKFLAGPECLARQAHALFGPLPTERDARIMVTMPSEAADDASLIHNLLLNGMNCMRINCAHDSISSWRKMIDHLRVAEKETKTQCKIIMDLAGPKLRTGAIITRPGVIKCRPERDYAGNIICSARIVLTNTVNLNLINQGERLLVSARFLKSLSINQKIKLTDSRGANRKLNITEIHPGYCIAESDQTIYLSNGVILTARLNDQDKKIKYRIHSIPRTESIIRLEVNDELYVTPASELGHPAILDDLNNVKKPATIGCTCFEIFKDVQEGEPIWFDDGKIGGIIESISGQRIKVRITHTRVTGGKLASDKGINLPESRLNLSALTGKDLEDIKFVANQADMLALSFANTVDDVERLQKALAELSDTPPAIILKIETRRGFENFPAMLLASMKSKASGVMIARGDLAVECGFERLAEVQEEILWLCEAAHTPVIWATQVLEHMAKEGLPSRAEISDVVLAQRAECVMLNKGAHIIEAVKTLDDILKRMQSHQSKKRSMLRELHLADLFQPTNL